METVNLKFGEALISFEKKDREVMVNATQMAKVFGKEVTFFLRNEDTKRFIDSCLKTANSQFLNIKTRDDLVLGKQKSGTWMHRVLALKFAAWLNPDFEVWVYTTIDTLLYDYAKIQEQTISETVRIQKVLKEKTAALEKSNEDYQEIRTLEKELKESKSKRTSNTKKKFREVWDLFNQD